MPNSTIKKLAIYDLRYCPLTFDFAAFIANARYYFGIKTGETSFDLMIIASDYRQVSPRDKESSREEKDWRLFNLIMPIVSCSPFIRNMEISRERPNDLEKNIFIYPNKYNIHNRHSPGYYLPVFCRKMYRKGFDPGCFQAPKYAINHAKELLCSKNPIAVISPRYTKFEASRNTKVEYVDKMIEKAIKAGFDVCYIHDQEDTGVIHEKITRRKELK